MSVDSAIRRRPLRDRGHRPRLQAHPHPLALLPLVPLPLVPLPLVPLPLPLVLLLLLVVLLLLLVAQVSLRRLVAPVRLRPAITAPAAR